MQTAAQSTTKVRPIIVNVYAEKSDDGRVTFRHDWKFEGEPGTSKGTIDVPPGAPNDPPTKMQFHLHDSTGLQLKFVRPTSDAMWVSQTDTCPDQAGDGGQISYNHPWSAKMLEVDDANSGPPCTLYYTLRFDGDPSTDPDGKKHPPYEYDPDIKNGGGTNPIVDAKWSTLTVIAITAAVLTLMAAVLWLT